jgi:hypothetical protein
VSVYPSYGDIISDLKALRGASGGLMQAPTIDRAIVEIERLRSVERRLNGLEERPEFKQADKWGYERGYRQAQVDIRRALGIDE